MRLQIKLLVSAETDNLMRFYSWGIRYTWSTVIKFELINIVDTYSSLALPLMLKNISGILLYIFQISLMSILFAIFHNLQVNENSTLLPSHKKLEGIALQGCT